MGRSSCVVEGVDLATRIELAGNTPGSVLRNRHARLPEGRE
ncbi:hypothetical protein SGL43_06407 [Streptomyces globisporus]|uniref:Uncharacterized protein n=1 Tax=Streptomyces globisporus TaxID=1908 RepID=A0ABN8V949_STRGL|nr:hypothetical protein SGL43_06407 [Streptomyces globisporus]